MREPGSGSVSVLTSKVGSGSVLTSKAGSGSGSVLKPIRIRNTGSNSGSIFALEMRIPYPALINVKKLSKFLTFVLEFLSHIL